VRGIVMATEVMEIAIRAAPCCGMTKVASLS
jgi:hypothetical protein